MAELLQSATVQEALAIVKSEFAYATWESFYMTVLATLFACILGIPLGILLVVGEENGIRPLPKPVLQVLNVVINLLRSVPFLILMIMVFPLSRLILGTTIGTKATIVPLTVAAFPFVARMVETSIREVDKGVIEAAQAMGCSPFQIIWKVLLPESLPSQISNITIALTTILGYGAMAGIIGGGGLGKIAINYGYYRYRYLVMVLAVILLVIMVQVFQSLGTHLSVHSDKRITKVKKKRSKKQ
jgi:D-methionine transport system permease protein